MHVLYILLAKTRGIKYFNVGTWMCFAPLYQNFWLRAWPMPIFCNTQTTVERQYFNAMKKRITWNSAQTWVIRRQPSVSPRKTWERMLRHRPVYWDYCGVIRNWILRSTWCSRRAACRKEQYRVFALIIHRWSSNLGFRILRAEN